MFVHTLLPLAPGRLANLAEDAALIEAASLLHAGIDLVTVCHSDGSLAGVVSKTDVVEQISHCQGASCTCPVATVMSRDVLLCTTGDSLPMLWATMRDRGIKNVPLVDAERKPVGIVTARDVLQVLLTEAEAEEVLLRDYVMGFGYH